MANTVTVSKTQYEQLVRRVDRLEKFVTSWVKGTLKTEPPYGSDAWWEKEEAEADKDIKAGRVIGPFHNTKQLQSYLDSLK